MRYPAQLTLALCAAVVGAACQEPAPSRFELVFQARTDTFKPLPYVAVRVDGTARGHTNLKGELSVELSGREGQRVGLAAACPNGYGPAQLATSAWLRPLADLGSGRRVPLKLQVRCPAQELGAALLVRTNRAGVGIWIDGIRRGQTDRDGLAEIALRTQRGSKLHVRLDTRRRPRLRPTNPERSFVVDEPAELMLYEQRFAERPLPNRRRRRRAAPEAQPKPERHIPYRIGSGSARSHAVTGAS